MLLDNIVKSPLLALDYMERLVNDGSKSGFTNIHNTSDETNPFHSEGFLVKKLIADKDDIKCYGEKAEEYSILDADNFIFLHPDWLSCDSNAALSSLGVIENGEWVIPTSSSRTVRVQNSNLYLKLCYPGMIGRLNRELKFPQLISGIEITKIFEQAKNFPDFFEYMPEPYGRILKKNEHEMGFILRELPKSLMNYYLIPGFSLFSKDRNHPDDEVLMIQILRRQNNPFRFILDDICFPLIDVFFACAFNEGLIPEMHSQNVIFAFDDNWKMQKIVLRDFESIDKDVSIRSNIGKDTAFSAFPYKCLSDSNKNYLKKHSFMYDHKLCEYLVDPLVACASRLLKLRDSVIQNEIKGYVNSKYHDFLSGFFPSDGLWYKYPDTEIDRNTSERPFTSMGKAVYR